MHSFYIFLHCKLTLYISRGLDSDIFFFTKNLKTFITNFGWILYISRGLDSNEILFGKIINKKQG